MWPDRLHEGVPQGAPGPPVPEVPSANDDRRRHLSPAGALAGLKPATGKPAPAFSDRIGMTVALHAVVRPTVLAAGGIRCEPAPGVVARFESSNLRPGPIVELRLAFLI